MEKVACGTCGKEYYKNSQVAVDCKPVCYGCALKRLIGNGGPEEADINTALLQSGETSDDLLNSLQEDLESVDYASRACPDCGQIHCYCSQDQDDEDSY